MRDKTIDQARHFGAQTGVLRRCNAKQFKEGNVVCPNLSQGLVIHVTDIFPLGVAVLWQQ